MNKLILLTTIGKLGQSQQLVMELIYGTAVAVIRRAPRHHVPSLSCAT